MPSDTIASPRRAWTAAAVLGHAQGNSLSSILVMARSRAEAISAAIQEAAANLPKPVGENYNIINAHAMEINPDVLSTAVAEMSETQASSRE